MWKLNCHKKIFLNIRTPDETFLTIFLTRFTNCHETWQEINILLWNNFFWPTHHQSDLLVCQNVSVQKYFVGLSWPIFSTVKALFIILLYYDGFWRRKINLFQNFEGGLQPFSLSINTSLTAFILTYWKHFLATLQKFDRENCM